MSRKMRKIKKLQSVAASTVVVHTSRIAHINIVIIIILSRLSSVVILYNTLISACV